LIHLAILSGVALIFIPLAWTLSTSLKSPAKWIPEQLRWGNYFDDCLAITNDRVLKSAIRSSVITGQSSPFGN